MKRLAIAGAGHAHIEVLREFAERPPPCEVAVVSPYPWLTYSGMVPGFVAGHYALEQCTVDVATLCRRAGARQVLASVVSLDASCRELVCSDGERIGYDVLSLDVGSRPMTEAASGIERHAIVVRPLERLVKGWTDVLAGARQGGTRSITLVGTGAAGLELAFAMHHRRKTDLGEAAPHLRIVGDSASPVPEFSAGARRRLQAEIHHRRIESHHGSGVVEVGTGFVRLRNGLEFATDAVFWTAGSDPMTGSPKPGSRPMGAASCSRTTGCNRSRTRRSSAPATAPRSRGIACRRRAYSRCGRARGLRRTSARWWKNGRYGRT